MYKTIGVLAHVDAGKTTFSEQLLYKTNSIKTRGRVDHQSAFLDSNDIERSRGITIFAEQGRFQLGSTTYNLIDTPGHSDFSSEMERALRVMDYAIVLISAVEGIQGHTETIWQLLKRYEIPTFIFINKTDRAGASVDNVMQDLALMGDNFLHINQFPFTEDATERIVALDEDALTAYLQGDWDVEQTVVIAENLIKKRQLFLCMNGSALQDQGIDTFIEVVHTLSTTNYDTSSTFAGEVYKIRHEGAQKITYLKALQGTVHARAEFTHGERIEKMNEIRVYNGSHFEQVQHVEAGDLFAVKGLTSFQIGDYLGCETISTPFELKPLLQSKVHYDGPLHIRDLLKTFYLVETEEPSLKVLWQEQLQQIHVHFMGAIQIEVITTILKDRFNLQVTFDKPTIIYMESIANKVNGYGHFEPLKHYAEVHLALQPNERGKGLTFSSICHTDALLPGHQRTIQHHLMERAHHGLLTGSAVTDVHITLLTGRAHEKHTSGGDFREAAFRALRQGLEQAENVLLEPYYTFKMRAEIEHLGRMMTDIQKAFGQFIDPILTETHGMLTGTVPVVNFIDYSQIFLAYTSGRGSISLQPAGYNVCHNADEIMEMRGYDKNVDLEYSSNSIFCAKGKGYTIPWHEAKAAMHCPTEI